MNRRNFIETSALLASGIGLAGFAKKKTHILTLSFDDGFKKSFYAIADIHERYGLKACLNVIATGHLPGFSAGQWIHHKQLGNFDDWNKLKLRGHELMPHSWDHKLLPDLPLEEAKENLDKCFEYFEDNLDGYTPEKTIYNFAYNASTPELDDHALKSAAAVRTGGWLVLKGTQFNALPADSRRLRLGCWSHGPDNADHFVQEHVSNFLKASGGWRILNLHGLDDEGWGPLSATFLDTLLKRLVKINHLDISPAAKIISP